MEEFEADGKVRPPLLTDATRWRRLVIDYPGMASVQLMGDGPARYYRLTVDTEKNTLTLKDYRNQPEATLVYEQPEPGQLVVRGDQAGRAVRMKLRRFDEAKFLLVNRGFHWVNEYPFNR